MNLADTLSRAWGLNVRAVRETQGGFVARAFAVDAAEGRFFLKMYELCRAPARRCAQRVAAYMPAMQWLAQNSPLRGRMPAARPTAAGGYAFADGGRACVLLEYMEGETLRDKPLSVPQALQLADIAAQLHSCGPEAPGAFAIAEDFALPFAHSLAAELKSGAAGPASCTLASCREPLLRLCESALRQADALRRSPPPFVLCHTDIHGYNLIAGPSGLCLLDWEGLRLAPAEADMIFFARAPFREAFFAAYGARRPGFAINPDALRFYFARRKLEDVWEWIERLNEEALPQKERERALGELALECQNLPA